MKKPLTMLAVAGALAVCAAPAGATKPTDKGPSGHSHSQKAKVPSAQKQCREERSAMGADTFKATYGTNKNQSNAFGKCVSKRNAATREARKEARGDVGKVVKKQVKTEINAAKTCQDARKADAEAFAKAWGAHRNAFGKCVSKTASEAHTG